MAAQVLDQRKNKTQIKIQILGAVINDTKLKNTSSRNRMREHLEATDIRFGR